MRTNLPPHVPPDHPVVTQRYAIFTPAIAAMVHQIGNWIESQKSGGYVWGYPLYGKSYGVRYFLHEMLKERFGREIPLVIWSLVEYKPTYMPNQFWAELLRAGKRPYPNPRVSTSRRLEVVMEMFIASARRAKGNFVVLLIDEAQGLRESEWKMLIGLQNQLVIEGFRLSVISVASHDMSYTHDGFAMTGNAHVAARFLAEDAQFMGAGGIEDLEFILRGYDEDSEWPDGSGRSYTASLAPKEFDGGFRIGSSKTELWSALVKCLPTDIEMRPEFPMQHIALAVESVLLRIAEGADPDELTSSQAWSTTVSETGLANHLRLISAIPRKLRSIREVR